MDTTQILIWAMSGGFAGTWAFLFYLVSRMDKLDNRIDKLQDGIQSLKDDMIEIKTILRMKECCMIQDDRKSKTAE